MDSATTARLQFEPPGPGTWEIDAVHFPRPVTRYFSEGQQEPFQRGFRELTRSFDREHYELRPAPVREEVYAGQLVS